MKTAHTLKHDGVMSPPHAEIQEDSELHTNRDVFGESEGRTVS